MEIKYDVYWKTKNGTYDITHGVLIEDDLREAVRLKEDCETLHGIPVEIDSVTWESVDL